jgi:hypothetical protein
LNDLLDEKEEGILGSILLPSFQIAVLSSEDHINRKYAFKVRKQPVFYSVLKLAPAPGKKQRWTQG